MLNKDVKSLLNKPIEVFLERVWQRLGMATGRG
jgi:hypothetical protein